MEQRVSFVTLAVTDLDRTRRFYVDGLGWEPELDVPGEVLMVPVGDRPCAPSGTAPPSRPRWASRPSPVPASSR